MSNKGGVDPVFLRVQEVQKILKYDNVEMPKILGISYESFRKQRQQQRGPQLYSLIRLDNTCGFSIEWLLFGRGPMRLADREKEYNNKVDRAIREYKNKYNPFDEPIPEELVTLLNHLRTVPALRNAVMQLYYKYLNDHPELIK